MKRLIASFSFCALVCLVSPAQERKPDKAPPYDPEKTKTVLPNFPRINTAPWYEVDKKWPQRPEAYEPAAVPGIAVDSQDQVWVFTRTKPPVQVYSTVGKLIRAWGDETVGNAHHIKIDPDGNIWLADIGWHDREPARGNSLVLTRQHLGLRLGWRSMEEG